MQCMRYYVGYMGQICISHAAYHAVEHPGQGGTKKKIALRA